MALAFLGPYVLLNPIATALSFQYNSVLIARPWERWRFWQVTIIFKNINFGRTFS